MQLKNMAEGTAEDATPIEQGNTGLLEQAIEDAIVEDDEEEDEEEPLVLADAKENLMEEFSRWKNDPESTFLDEGEQLPT